MVCEHADQVYGNDWCPVANTYCTPGKECDFDHNHQTNADRIRAMSDEELAELIWAIMHENDVLMIEKLNKKGIEASLVEAPDLDIARHLEWLKQPVED